MMPGRFFLGVGTGENLNEHILGSIWPSHEVRRAMLKEAVEVIRELWKGKNTSFYGDFYVIENAKIYTLPKERIPIYLAADGPMMARLAGKIGDGLICTSPDAKLVEAFLDEAEHDDLPLCCQVTVCYDEDEEKAKKIAHQQWPTSGFPGELSWELPTPEFFEQTATLVTQEIATKHVGCGADPKKHLELIQKYLDAGFKKISVHNIGPNQEGFFRFYHQHIIPKVMGTSDKR